MYKMPTSPQTCARKDVFRHKSTAQQTPFKQANESQMNIHGAQKTITCLHPYTLIARKQSRRTKYGLSRLEATTGWTQSSTPNLMKNAIENYDGLIHSSGARR